MSWHLTHVGAVCGFALWCVFWAYWLISARTNKKGFKGGRTVQSMGVRVVVLIALIILLRLSGLHESHLSFHGTVLVWIGLLIQIVGLVLAVWARVYIGTNWGMPMTQRVNHELVTTGPYHYVRHPIYSGIILAVIGSAVSTSWVIFFGVLVGVVYFLYAASQEEKTMEGLFPNDYPAYRARTKKLIPFLI